MIGYAGIYAQGWDKIRAQHLARQKEIGLAPGLGTPLTPRSKIPKPEISKRVGFLDQRQE